MNQAKLMEKKIALPDGFSAGFAREAVNPLPGTGLAGFGNPGVRKSTEVLDDLMFTCVALSDGDEIFLFVTQDILSLRPEMYEEFAERVEAGYGIPAANVVYSCTHTHCAPILGWPKVPGVAEFTERYWAAMERIVEESIGDLSPATLKIGHAHTDGINYVRRYVSKKDGSFLGNWPKMQYPEDARHESEPDTLLQVLYLKREEKKDILLCNWQCHPCSEIAGDDKTQVSADWVGVARQQLEERDDVLFAFYQGAAGNLTSSTKIVGEKRVPSYKVAGMELCQTIEEAMKNAVPTKTDKFRSVRKEYEAQHNEVFREKKKADFMKLYLTVLSIGDVAFATVPCEWHCDNGRAVRTGSPFKMTFVCGYSNGAASYIPANFCWENGGYEVKKCQFHRGIGEILVDELVAGLTEVK